MNIEDLKLLKLAVKQAEQNFIDAKKQFAEDNTKLKVGDIVPITSYPHEGKNIIVDKIYFGDKWNGRGIVASGRVLKKDGEAGVNIGIHLELKVDL
jgi:serine protease inhibitor